MALKNQAITVTYVAWDTSANAGKTGDAANHTLKLIQDGTAAAPTNNPSEVDSTNAPGVYKLALTAGDMDFNAVTLCGKSSTSGVSIIPVVIVTERGALPNAAPGANGGLPTVDASNGVKLSVGTGTGQVNVTSGKVPATMGSTDYAGNTVQTGDSFARIGATGSGLTSLAPASTALSTADWTTARAGYLDNLNVGGAVASHADALAIETAVGTPMQAGSSVTVGTNLDKTGYSLTQAFPTNFASLAITVGGAVTAGTVSDKTGYSLTQAFPANFADLAITATTGKVTVGTNSDKTGYSLTQSFPSNFASLAIPAAGAVTAGTVGDKTGYGLASDGLDAIMVEAEAGLNFRQSQSIIASAVAGAGGTSSNLYKGAGVETTRIAFTAAGGERTAVTLSPPA